MEGWHSSGTIERITVAKPLQRRLQILGSNSRYLKEPGISRNSGRFIIKDVPLAARGVVVASLAVSSGGSTVALKNPLVTILLKSLFGLHLTYLMAASQ